MLSWGIESFGLSRPKYQEYYICSHNVHANLSHVDLNRHPKWSILGSTSLRNLQRETKCYFLLELYNFPMIFTSFLD